MSATFHVSGDNVARGLGGVHQDRQLHGERRTRSERLFADHLAETEGQLANLEQAFSALGEEAAGHTCYGMDGMKKEAEDMIEKITPELLDGALAVGATHVEHYEIATYEGLLRHAEAMGAEDVVALLQENLEQEQQTLAKVESAAARLAQRAASSARL